MYNRGRNYALGVAAQCTQRCLVQRHLPLSYGCKDRSFGILSSFGDSTPNYSVLLCSVVLVAPYRGCWTAVFIFRSCLTHTFIEDLTEVTFKQGAMFRFMYAVSVLTAVTAGPVTALVARAPTGTQALNASGPASELMQRSQLVQRGAPPSNPGTLTINIKNDFGVPLLAKVASNPGTAGPANAGKLVLADSLVSLYAQ